MHFPTPPNRSIALAVLLGTAVAEAAVIFYVNKKWRELNALFDSQLQAMR